MSHNGSTDAAAGAHKYPLLTCCTSQSLLLHGHDMLILALRARTDQT